MNNTSCLSVVEGTCTLKQPVERPSLVKEIGGTTYEVFLSFSKTSKEDMNDKMLRLIKNDAVLR